MPLKYILSNVLFLAFCFVGVIAQNSSGTITLVVTDENNRPLPGIRIRIREQPTDLLIITKNGTATLELTARSSSLSSIHIYVEPQPGKPAYRIQYPPNGIIEKQGTFAGKSVSVVLKAESSRPMKIISASSLSRADINTLSAKMEQVIEKTLTTKGKLVTAEERKMILLEHLRPYGIDTIEQLDQILTKFFQQKISKTEQGIAHLINGENEKAETILGEAETEYQKQKKKLDYTLAASAKTTALLAESLAGQGKIQQSLVKMREAVSYQPQDTKLACDLAWTAMAAGAQDTEELVKRALGLVKKETNPDKDSIWGLQATLILNHVLQGHFQEAEKLLRDLVEDDRKQKGMVFGFGSLVLGLVEEYRKNTALAEQYFREGEVAIKALPREDFDDVDPEIILKMFRAVRKALSSKDDNEIKAQFKEFLDTLASLAPPDSPYAISMSGVMNIINGDYAAAEKSYLNAYEQSKKDAQTPFNKINVGQTLISIYLEQNKIEEARKIANDLLEDFRADTFYESPIIVGGVVSGFASALTRIGMCKEAAIIYERALRFYQSSNVVENLYQIFLFQNYGDNCLCLRDYEGTEKAYKRAYSLSNKQLGEEDETAKELLEKLANLAVTRGRLDEAETLYRQILSSKLPENHSTKNINLGLARVLANIGKYEEAEKLIKDIQISENKEAQDAEFSFWVVDLLALIREFQGKYEEAGQLQRDNIDRYETLFGKERPGLATLKYRLAMVDQNLGKIDEAERLFLSAMKIDQKAKGPEDPEVATSLNALGNLYRSQQKLDKAESYFQEALRIREKAFGVGSPEICELLQGLAWNRYDQKQYEQAIKFLKRSLEIREQSFNFNHWLVGESLYNLGFATYPLNRKEADQLLKRAVHIFEGHEKNSAWAKVSAARDLGDSLFLQNEFTEAEKYFGIAIQWSEKYFGQHHVQTARSRSSLGGCWFQQGQYQKSVAEFREAEKIFAEITKGKGIDYENAVYNLSWALFYSGNIKEAIPYLHKKLSLVSERLGEENIESATILKGLGDQYFTPDSPKQWQQAEDMYKQVWAIYERQNLQESLDAAALAHDLARVLREQKKISESEKYFQVAISLREKNLGSFHPLLFKSKLSLSVLFAISGREKQAQVVIDEVIEKIKQSGDDVKKEMKMTCDGFISTFEAKKYKRLASHIRQRIQEF